MKNFIVAVVVAGFSLSLVPLSAEASLRGRLLFEESNEENQSDESQPSDGLIERDSPCELKKRPRPELEPIETACSLSSNEPPTPIKRNQNHQPRIGRGSVRLFEGERVQRAIDPADLVETVSGSEFQVIRTLGAGENGKVLRVIRRNEETVLKICNETGLKITQKEFNRQVKAAAVQVAPQIVGSVFRYQEPNESPKFAFQMEFIPGAETLKSVFVSSHNRKELSQRLATSVFSQLLVLHENAGIPHGDINPENILVLPSMETKLIDFGVPSGSLGRQEYHLLESPTLNEMDQDFVALVLVFLELNGDYDPNRDYAEPSVVQQAPVLPVAPLKGLFRPQITKERTRASLQVLINLVRNSDCFSETLKTEILVRLASLRS
ncbi:MAG: hypothetical protein HYX41_03475 [Bdellovibrio sp.]|nr:hypothetical protein [Bdellovibrio sp.]